MKIKDIILSIIKLLALILLISLERVVGLPLIFTLLALIWLDQKRDNLYFYPILLLLISYIFAVTYNALWSLSLLVWTVTSILANLNIKQIKSKNKRFFITVILHNIFWLWWLSLPVGYSTVVQFILSYALVVMWMRMLKGSKIRSY